jgi:hypothetical protein
MEYIVAREKHADGEYHLHVYWKRATPTNFKKPNCLDLQGLDGKVYHGNYRSCRSSNAVKQYLLCPKLIEVKRK